jgi:hypothetical protein
MTRIIVVAALLLVSCGKISTPPTPTDSPGPATPRPSLATPIPPPVTSAKGAITLKAPLTNATLTSPVTISGDASVFEANVQWRISDTSGRVLAEGFTTASLGAPGRGDFSVTATYTVTRETIAFVEVFSRSAKDGNVDEIVRIPVVLR